MFKNYLLLLPVVLMVASSQLIVKWRTNTSPLTAAQGHGEYLFKFITDPIILIAYAVALISSFGWLYVITRLPLTLAFPLYIGGTYALVLLGGWFFLAEIMTLSKAAAIALIMSGIALAIFSDA
jgi:multidrug transporter EmrE-like cation transporter